MICFSDLWTHIKNDITKIIQSLTFNTFIDYSQMLTYENTDVHYLTLV